MNIRKQKGGCEKTEMRKMNLAIKNLNTSYDEYKKNKNKKENKNNLLKCIK